MEYSDKEMESLFYHILDMIHQYRAKSPEIKHPKFIVLHPWTVNGLLEFTSGSKTWYGHMRITDGEYYIAEIMILRSQDLGQFEVHLI